MAGVENRAADGATNSRALMLELDLRRGHLRHGLQHALRTAIQDGRLTAGTRLPSSRSLAAELKISRGDVVHTYDQLAAECYLDVRPRQAPVVAVLTPVTRVTSPSSPDSLRPGDSPEPMIHDFIATTPDVELFPRRAWLHAVERAVTTATNEALDYGDHRGRIELRTELAAYLGRVRGLRITPERVVITQGFTQALDLLCRVLRARGTPHIWFESPSLADEWGTARQAGLEVRPVPVDGAGIRTELLPEERESAVVVTPAHQFPTGAVMAPERRHALVAWAQRNHGLIVEDDYDAEFRYDRAGIGALQGLAPEHVVHIGTASKTLAPGVRLGWMSLPGWLVADLRAAKASADSGSPAIDQLALAELIKRGDLERQIHGARQVYRQRRDALVAAVARRLPEARVEGAAAGLGMLLRLNDVDDVELVRAAASRGIRLRPLSPLVLTGPPQHGLLLGYARLSPAKIDAAVEALAALIRVAPRAASQAVAGSDAPAAAAH
jgi:GntR family transcriptional regulator/MocR family aminotransferase